MEILIWKTRIAVLWVFMAVAMSAHGLLVAMVPGGLEKATSEVESMGSGMLVFMALFWLVPLWLAFVSMTLKDSANRWVNFILGIIFTLLNIWHFTEHVAEPAVEQILIIGSTVVVTALIAWFAWRWPKQEV
jgi:drug/metabolite transporter (DMT)-like permease